MSAERWLPLVGWEGVFEVSDQGNIRRVGSKKPRAAHSNGWGYLGVVLDYRGRRARVANHRAVLEAFVGPCPDGMEACHSNGVKTDNRLVNLRWDTHVANSGDRITHGSQFRPSTRPTCRKGHPLTPGNVSYSEKKGYTMRRCLACGREANRRAKARRLAAASGSAVALVLAVASAAFATAGPGHKELICHPVNGAGQTGTGWTLVNVDKASSHFDQYGNPKHRSHDGRMDTYATSGVCPSSPSPTTTGGTPSPTTTTVPATATSTTSRPTTSAPSTTGQPTTTSASPSQTSSAPSTPRPSTATTGATSGPTRTGKPVNPSTASSAPSSPTNNSPRRSVPSSTVAPPELAHTGFNSEALLTGLGILLAGAAFHGIRRMGVRHGNH